MRITLLFKPDAINGLLLGVWFLAKWRLLVVIIFDEDFAIRTKLKLSLLGFARWL